MACSCKAKKNVQYRDPLTGVNRTAEIDKVQEPQQPPRQRTPQEIIKDLDVSSVTKPDQVCFNCCRKHLGMAYMFLSWHGWRRYWAAVGQLMCIVTHLQNDFPFLAYKVLDVAVQVLRDPDNRKDLVQELIQGFAQDPKQDLQSYTPGSITDQQRDLMVLMLTYSLLFVELTYEEVNKTWATAHLSFTAYLNFRSYTSVESYNQLRPLWKMIQSMQPGDQTYLKARDYLQTLLQTKYNKYVKARQIKQQQEREALKNI